MPRGQFAGNFPVELAHFFGFAFAVAVFIGSEGEGGELKPKQPTNL
jgi:hypothetical protein